MAVIRKTLSIASLLAATLSIASAGTQAPSARRVTVVVAAIPEPAYALASAAPEDLAPALLDRPLLALRQSAAQLAENVEWRLPQPDRWTAGLATIALAAFYFLRRRI